jgi:hypothetical protein
MQRLRRFPRRQFPLEYLIGICREEEALDRRFVAYADRIDLSALHLKRCFMARLTSCHSSCPACGLD